VRHDSSTPSRWLATRVGVLAALGLASAAWPKLGLPAAFLVLLGWISLPGLAGGARRLARGAMAVATLGASAGLLRFVAEEAAPGIIAGGRRATEQSAVSRLREILFAEDALRTHAWWDPDRDGVGSAALLGELSGAIPLRGGTPLAPPPYDARRAPMLETPIGPALEAGGYLFVVCLPAARGGWTARPGDPVDEERAERHWIAYAWPASASEGVRDAYFLDQHERILVSSNGDAPQARWAGPSFPPPCDAALAAATRAEWKPWRGKKPRATLRGER
jgi:hypothetical protein